MTRKFEFQTKTEDIEIAGKTYTLDFSDEKVMEYNREFEQFFLKTQDLQKKDVKDLSAKEQNEMFLEMRKLVKDFVDLMLGDGEFERLYKESGNSLLNMVDMVYFLAEPIKEKAESIRADQLKKYTGLKVNANALPSSRE